MLRVVNRLGFVRSDDPVIVERVLTSALPPERWTRASDTLILHGRRICRPRPLCDRCAVRSSCAYFRALGAKAAPRGRCLAEASAKADQMTRTKFRELVDEALAGIPARFRKAMKNIAIVIEDEPTAEELEEVGIEPPDTLLGLYQGTPLTERQWAHGNVLPDKITLFQGPIEDVERR